MAEEGSGIKEAQSGLNGTTYSTCLDLGTVALKGCLQIELSERSGNAVFLDCPGGPLLPFGS